MSKYHLEFPQEKINALSEIVEMISGFYSEVERDVYIQAVSKQLDVPFNSVKNDVNQKVQQKKRRYLREEGQKARQSAAGFADKVNLDFAKAPAVAKNEENVIGLLILFENHQKKVFSEKLLSAADFYTDLNRSIFLYLQECYETGVQPNFDEKFPPEAVGRIAKMKISRMNLTDNGDAVLAEAIASLKGAMQRKSAEGVSTMDALNHLIAAKRESDQN